jgi:hypothetical protein
MPWLQGDIMVCHVSDEDKNLSGSFAGNVQKSTFKH